MNTHLAGLISYVLRDIIAVSAIYLSNVLSTTNSLWSTKRFTMRWTFRFVMFSLRYFFLSSLTTTTGNLVEWYNFTTSAEQICGDTILKNNPILMTSSMSSWTHSSPRTFCMIKLAFLPITIIYDTWHLTKYLWFYVLKVVPYIMVHPVCIL